MGQIVSILTQGIIFAYFSIVFFVMLGDNTSFFFFISLFFVSFFVILRYYYFLQKLFYYYYIIIIFFFFYDNHFYFFMFRNVPECSGMFRHVPQCSVFRVLSTPWNMANHRFTETVDQRYALILVTVKRETFLCRFILQILTLLSCTVTYHMHNTKDCQRLQRANRESSLWRNTFVILQTFFVPRPENFLTMEMFQQKLTSWPNLPSVSERFYCFHVFH